MTDIEKFTGAFKEQFIDADSIEVTADTSFRNIESWDSLTGMSILVMVKDEYGVDIPVETFKQLNTVQQVYDFVASNQEA